MRKQFAPLKRCLAGGLLHTVLRTLVGVLLIALLFAGMLGCASSSGGVQGVTAGKTSSTRGTQMASARQFSGQTDTEGFPAAHEWENATAIRFCNDWQGKNADPERETEVRLLWNRDALFINFLARFRSITVFADAEASGRRDQLWNRDVAEVFLQPSGSDARRYKEFEVSPNGLWIDLGIAPGEKWDLKSGLRRRSGIDETRKIWRAELILPMKSLTEHFDAAQRWRVNFFRVEGGSEPRFYSAWRPTGTPTPNFHVPTAFGELAFER